MVRFSRYVCALILGAIVALCITSIADAAPVKRSYAAKKAFAMRVPCPLTGLHTISCRKGKERYVIDHIWPLCAGGLDIPENMQWQEITASYRKDVQERYLCRPAKVCKV